MLEGLEHTQKNGWTIYSEAEQRAEIHALADAYLDFLSRCKTERETVRWVEEQARQAGFSEDMSSAQVMRSLKSKTILLARKGRRPLSQGFRLLGAHADSPRLDFKQHPMYETCDLALAKTHYYGGIRKHQWLSRPLALHGVVVKEDG